MFVHVPGLEAGLGLIARYRVREDLLKHALEMALVMLSLECVCAITVFVALVVNTCVHLIRMVESAMIKVYAKCRIRRRVCHLLHVNVNLDGRGPVAACSA